MTTQIVSPYQDFFNRFDYSDYNNNINNVNQINSNINENLSEDDIDFHNIAIRLNFDYENDVNNENDENNLYLIRLIPIELDRLRNMVTNEELCPICLEYYTYENVSEICTVQCTHCFHTKCVTNWLMIGHQTCPMCRTLI